MKAEPIAFIKNAQFCVPLFFEDQHLVVLSKPAGLLSQSDKSGIPSLVDLLRVHFDRHYVGLVHRLDQQTTGLMVIAKRSKSAQRLTDQLQKGLLQRQYQAFLTGHFCFPDKTEEWEDFLWKNEKTNTSFIVSQETAGAKKAILRVKVLLHEKIQQIPVSLCEFELKTGRSHQIRVQAAFRGHPVLGDKRYDPDQKTGYPLCLHSSQLDFFHPLQKEKMQFFSPLQKP
jgi:23S rRNA pseudouridine1911/1915/1917 synthase